MTPGQRIKEARESKKMTQQALAKIIGRITGKPISRAAVAKWESGTSKTQKPENMFAAAKALGLNPQWVLDETGPKHAHANGIRLAVAEPTKSADYSEAAKTPDEQVLLEGYRAAPPDARHFWLDQARHYLEISRIFDKRSEQ